MSVAPELVTPPALASLEARALGHWYAPGRGLEPVSFEIAAPAVVAVTGANGSGKSTLLRIVAGLLRPSTGAANLSLGGAPLAPAARRLAVGYAFPELAFYPEMTVTENLSFAGEARGLRAVAVAVRSALAEVGLERVRDDRVDALSSGMIQRLRLAFAVLHRPLVLLLDEPGSHLDDDGRAVVSRLVHGRRASGLVLIATNDEREWALADRRIELRGRGLGHPA